MPDYQQSKIYIISCRTDNTLIYVGSTTQSLAVRWGGHKRNSKRERDKDNLIYTTINGDWDNWYIELYELYPCNSKEELCKKEGEIIRLIGTLNSRIAGRTKKEWTDEYSEWTKEYMKKYQQDHKEEIYDKFKIRNIKIECECGCILNKNNLSKHIKRKAHIDKMNLQKINNISL
jgi:hypothetical protein